MNGSGMRTVLRLSGARRLQALLLEALEVGRKSVNET